MQRSKSLGPVQMRYQVFPSSLPFSGQSDCSYGLHVLWTSSLRNAPLTATPLLFDVDGDGYKDIVAPSVSGEVWAVHGENGHIVDNWPFYLEEKAFHASPVVVSLSVCVPLRRINHFIATY